VVWNEERRCQVCCSLWHLSVSQGWTSMTCWIAAAIARAWVEVERDCHEFYHGIAKYSVRIRFHLGNCVSINKGGSLYTCQDHLLRATTSRVVYVEGSLSTWSAKQDCVWQRETVYFEVLGEVSWNLGYPIVLQFCLSSSDRWLDQKSKSDSRRHAESLCSAIWEKLG
jgi:hypothetical protein